MSTQSLNSFTSHEFDTWVRSFRCHSTVRDVLRELRYTAEQYKAQGLGWTERSMNGIAERVGISRRRLNQIMAKLVNEKVVTVVHRKNAKAFNDLNQFCLSAFLKWVPHFRKERGKAAVDRASERSTRSQPKVARNEFQGGDETSFDQTNSTLPNSTSTRSDDHDLVEIPATGSVKNTPIAKIIRSALPIKEKGTCVDLIMKYFRERAANSITPDNPLTLKRLIGFCRTFKGPGQGYKPKAYTPKPAPETKPMKIAERPEPRGDCWDVVCNEVHKNSPHEWVNWFKPLVVQGSQKSGFVVKAPTRFHAGYVEQTYGSLIERVTGQRVRFEALG